MCGCVFQKLTDTCPLRNFNTDGRRQDRKASPQIKAKCHSDSFLSKYLQDKKQTHWVDFLCQFYFWKSKFSVHPEIILNLCRNTHVNIKKKKLKLHFTWNECFKTLAELKLPQCEDLALTPGWWEDISLGRSHKFNEVCYRISPSWRVWQHPI